MRDLVVLALIMAGALWALRQPWVGILLWTNVSLMSPHVEFGYATAGMPVAAFVAGTTLVGAMLTKDRQSPFIGPGMWTLLAFIVWVCITLPFSFYFDESLQLWIRSMKIFLMIFVTVALLNERRKVDAFVWVIVISIAYYGVKGGLFTILTGGGYRIWGPGGFIAGNNEVALALVTTIPLMRYLQLQMTRRWAILAMGASMGLTAIAVLGTYSRGAFLAIGAMALVFWIKNQQKAKWGILIVVGGLIALSLMPDHWWARMDTIKGYEGDDSALGRINAWYNAWNLAKDRVVGGGFMIYYPDVFARYSPDPARVHAAHSIYFQVLGEHGFIGLFLFLLMGLQTWFASGQLIRTAKTRPEHRWAAELGGMVQVSMAGFAAGGAFLSLAYFDLPYNLMVMVVVALHLVRCQLKSTAAQRAGSQVASATQVQAPVGRPPPDLRHPTP